MKKIAQNERTYVLKGTRSTIVRFNRGLGHSASNRETGGLSVEELTELGFGPHKWTSPALVDTRVSPR
jgi:hypothetical protein